MKCLRTNIYAQQLCLFVLKTLPVYLFLSACGSVFPDRQIFIDPSLQHVWEQFLADAVLNGADRGNLLPPGRTLHVRKAALGRPGSLGAPVIGECWGLGTPTRKVFIGNKLAGIALLEVFYHEMGHCLLDIGADEHTENGMMAANVDMYCLTEYGWPHCVNGLFKLKGGLDETLDTAP